MKEEKASKIFVRESSGLIKQFGMFDAAGKVMNVMLPLAAYYTLLYSPGVPGANNFGLSALIGFLFAIPPFYIYLRLSELIPRSSGEYIYISRFLHSLIGTIQGITTIIGMSMFTASLIITLTVDSGLVPFLQIIGLAYNNQSLVNYASEIISSPFYTFIISEIFVVIYFIIISFSNKILSKVVVVSLFLGQIIGTILVSAIFLALGNHGFITVFNHISQEFGSSQTYSEISSQGKSLIYPLNFEGTIIMAILLWLWILAWFIGPSYFAGEFKGGKKSIRRGMIIGWVIGGILLFLVSYSSEYAVGLPFFEYSSLHGWGNIPIAFYVFFLLLKSFLIPPKD
ncbi:amino acid permease [Sulfurisphaera ohwakuensis]|nr:amino acid permease [Sulfurisphaera ohwakuensis]MBB5255141.1 amino acid transporter [Sulfurisphaera ohwakuensis]